MLSNEDLERLITEKRREIHEEKTALGLSLPKDTGIDENVEKTDKQVSFRRRAVSENNVTKQDLAEDIPPDLERYIRRYTGLPAMLKAGEYSPNNPLIRAERTTGDVLLGLGEYERRRNTLRKIRQRQYKEYLDEQARIKQEAKEKAEKERKEREEKERLREERERERLELEREISPERRRNSVSQFERGMSPERRRNSVSHSYVSGSNNTYITKVDTGVQVDDRSTPLSVAVQTDDELYRLTSPGQSLNLLTEAERELSPHTVDAVTPWWRRRSYGHCDYDRTPLVRNQTRDRLTADLRHTYMPSIFDSEAIRLRNEQAEKEAAERRQYYQQELKNQIQEQQRIKEERRTREKMLEKAEMRKLEEQLRSLKMAQEREIERQHDLHDVMKENSTDYEKKRQILQQEIDLEHQALLKAAIHPRKSKSQNDSPKIYKERPPYSTNIPDNSIFSQNYDVENYLRRNLNPKEVNKNNKSNVFIEKAQVHEAKNKIDMSEKIEDFPIPVLRHSPKVKEKPPNYNEIPSNSADLRQTQSNAHQSLRQSSSNLSEKMQIVDDKWRVPAVQKNILKNLNEKGKNVSILTQLGSIRRQLQLEQLKLDKMMSKS